MERPLTVRPRRRSKASRAPASTAVQARRSDWTGPPIVLRELVRRFADLTVLDGLSLAVGGGERVAVVGPSGCGKSTLLRVIAGFDVPDGGAVTIDGNEVDGPSPSRGMVLQSCPLFEWLTVHGNIAYGPQEAGRADADALASAVIAETGLGGFDRALPRELSGGMRQRTAIAQVLVSEPPVLLLDEPFGALDAQTRLQMHEWLNRLLARRRSTVVLVTHDVDEALLLADRVVVLGPRPAGVVTDMAVDLVHPRTRATLVDPIFQAAKQRLLDALLGPS